MLSERQIMVLKAIVEEYVSTNEPVGSRTLSKRPDLPFSPATIRNDMADLEEMGYLEKTHTSSGRIPSEAGYRLYVEQIMKEKQKQEVAFPMLDQIFSQANITRQEAIRESLDLVADLTNYAAEALGQSAEHSRIKKLEFISLQERFAIILMVTDQGYVESKKIMLPEGISIKEVERVVKVLDELLHDVMITEIELRLKEASQNEEIRDFLCYREELIAAFVNAFVEMASNKYHIAGKTNILELPEFQDVKKARELFEAIENKEIFKVIRLDNSGITVRIGQENEIKAMQNCTVITVPYTSASGDRGAISVIGPTRMQYDKVIPILEYIASNIKKIV